MTDALKLLWIERRLFPGGTRKVLALADLIRGRSIHWPDLDGGALRDLGIEVVVVELPADVRAGILAAQARHIR